MKLKYYTSTNWAPWLGFAFLLSSFFFSTISNVWLMMFLILLSFFPAIVVALTLRGYFLVDNFQIKYCYDTKNGINVSFSLPISDIKSIKQAGKAVSIIYDRERIKHFRVHEAAEFVNAILKYNPRVERLSE